MRPTLSIAVAIQQRVASALALRRCFRVFLAGVLFFASTGITLVAPPPSGGTAAVAESDEWFPCKGHACGCISAEMCRTNCCCHRPAAGPAPIARSHCANEGAESGHKPPGAGAATTSSVKLVIRAATCGGGEASWVFKCECPVVRLERFALGLVVRPEKLNPFVSGMADQVALTPDPPPPRDC